jgi:hypothetical protein
LAPPEALDFADDSRWYTGIERVVGGRDMFWLGPGEKATFEFSVEDPEATLGSDLDKAQRKGNCAMYLVFPRRGGATGCANWFGVCPATVEAGMP